MEKQFQEIKNLIFNDIADLSTKQQIQVNIICKLIHRFQENWKKNRIKKSIKYLIELNKLDLYLNSNIDIILKFILVLIDFYKETKNQNAICFFAKVSCNNEIANYLLNNDILSVVFNNFENVQKEMISKYSLCLVANLINNYDFFSNSNFKKFTDKLCFHENTKFRDCGCFYLFIIFENEVLSEEIINLQIEYLMKIYSQKNNISQRIILTLFLSIIKKYPNISLIIINKLKSIYIELHLQNDYIIQLALIINNMSFENNHKLQQIKISQFINRINKRVAYKSEFFIYCYNLISKNGKNIQYLIQNHFYETAINNRDQFKVRELFNLSKVIWKTYLLGETNDCIKTLNCLPLMFEMASDNEQINIQYLLESLIILTHKLSDEDKLQFLINQILQIDYIDNLISDIGNNEVIDILNSLIQNNFNFRKPN